MKIIKNVLSTFLITILCLGSTIVFTGCGEPESPDFMVENAETYSLTEIVESGIYKNMDESKEDYLVISDDNTISLINFDEKELADSYAQLFEEFSLQKEEFYELLKTPYQATVSSGETEEMYTIRVPMFGDDANSGMNFKYNSEDKTIFYYRCLYKIEANE